MRRPLVLTAALSLAATLAACGQSGGDQGQGAGQAAAPAAPAPTEAEMKAAQAKLPAPYAAADLANGKTKYALCASCHTITPGGSNMTGPNLFGIVGQKAAHLPNYNYTEALKTSGLVWDAATLDKWLVNPRTLVPGTKMSFVGMRDPKDRTDLIAYLMVNAPAQ